MSSVFLLGVLFALHGVAAGFFLRFWRETGDRLFAAFAAAFALFALNQAAFVLWGEDEAVTGLYLVRLLGFVLILIGILDKNRR